jgi:RNA polymerase sigma-70 factor, ECF subfamily
MRGTLKMNADISVESIYKTMGESLKKHILVSVKDSHLADDIFQNIFLKIFNNLHQLKDSTKVHGWVFKIMRNTIIDAVRKQKKETSIPDDSIQAI